ncbi:hypothetical protein KY330_03665 [Candidatus Woesearchaeota archaeon]|nr:hypothetical protein [Candidatus Woesearchaeota archaeon]
MDKNIILRHYINEIDSYNELIKGVDNIKAGIDVAKGKDCKLNFGLKLTLKENLPLDLIEDVRDELRYLPQEVWLLYDPVDRGSGVSYMQVLFAPSFVNSLVMFGDLDQCVLDSDDSLSRLYDFFERFENENSLYAVGSRDIPVKLAFHQRNSDLRIIHELFHSFAIGPEKLKVSEQRDNVTPAYVAIGESTTGMCGLNTSHHSYPQLLESVTRAARRADLSGFATDYYVSIKSSQLAGITTGYLNTRENNFNPNLCEKSEFESIINMISTQTRELGKTDIADTISSILTDKYPVKKISEFYPREDVDLVANKMLEALLC